MCIRTFFFLSLTFLEGFEVKIRRRIVVIVGSDSDLPQCSSGLAYLKDEELSGNIDVAAVHTMSIHRNHDELYDFLKARAECCDTDIIIAGAGWAAHLPGMIDAILGYSFRNQGIHVIGVAFEDRENRENTLAAKLSISRVPGTRVIFSGDHEVFVGANGFLRACQFASEGELPALKVPAPRPSKARSLSGAMQFVGQSFIRATSTN